LLEELNESTVGDAGFEPQTSTASVASTVAWRFVGSGHEVREASAMALFDSGRQDDGDSYTTLPPAAGTYQLADPTSGHSGKLTVSMTAVRNSPDAIYLRWGTDTLKSSTCNCYYDVEIARPGWSIYLPFQVGTAQPGMLWKPPATSTGTFRFIARFRKGLRHTGWSPALAITFPQP
jgi:hypothetical protein